MSDDWRDLYYDDEEDDEDGGEVNLKKGDSVIIESGNSREGAIISVIVILVFVALAFWMMYGQH